MSIWYGGDYLRAEDAEPVATFSAGSLNGWPAVTRRETGGGVGWYVATLPDQAALRRLAKRVVVDAGIGLPSPVVAGEKAEVVRRGASLFVINHGVDEAELLVDGTDLLSGASTAGLRLPPQGVAVVVEKTSGA